MANSLVLDWIFENEQRAFPFKENNVRVSNGQTCTLTNDCILDAQFIFDSVQGDLVYLQTVTVSGDNVTFKVNGISFLFLKSGTFPQYNRLPSGHLMVAGKGIKNLPNGLHNFSVNNPALEAAVVHEYTGPWLGVKSLTFDNNQLVGSLMFNEGFQFEIGLSNNNITFGVNGLYGVPITCDTTPFNVNLLNDCGDIISFINGAGPTGKHLVHIVAGGGIVVLNDPPNHRIYIGFTFSDSADICEPIPNRPD